MHFPPIHLNYNGNSFPWILWKTEFHGKHIFVEFGLPEVDEFTLSKINLNFSFLLRVSYLLSATPGLVRRRGLEDPEDSANKSKEFERSQGFFMIRERRNDKNLEPFYFRRKRNSNDGQQQHYL